MLRRQPRKTVLHGQQEARLQPLVILRFGAGQTRALHHNLRACAAFGFDQNRVHINMRRKTYGLSLHGLCATNLAPSGADSRIVRHILWLKRRNIDPTLARSTTQPRNKQ